MGRPLKNIEEKRSVQVVVKLNKSEYNKLLALKIYYEKSVSECIRHLVFNPKPMPPKTSKVDIECVFQLKKLGINFNSYLKKIHQGELKYVDDSLIKDVLTLLNKIHRCLMYNSV